ncbi:MAG TPA: sigma-70 factor domain-containing protein, partial [Pseudonocardiaceae bacterium]
MVRIAARSDNQVLKAPRRTRQASVAMKGSERHDVSPVLAEVPGESVPWTIESVEDPHESVGEIEQPVDFVWDEEDSEALRRVRKEAELTISADSVRAYLKQIGKIPLLNAEEEVQLAQRIEAGLFAAERL